MKKIPCENCITLIICKNVVKNLKHLPLAYAANALIKKCSLADEYCSIDDNGIVSQPPVFWGDRMDRILEYLDNDLKERLLSASLCATYSRLTL